MSMLHRFAALGFLAPLALMFTAQGCSKPCNDLNEVCGRCGDATYAQECRDIVNEGNEDVCSSSVATFQVFCTETGEGGSGAASGGCSNGQVVCGGTCVDTNNSPSACGDCLTECTGDTPLCGGGVCVASCADTAFPDECSGGCVDFSNDPNNCNGCGATCEDGQVCNDGVCGDSCDFGEEDCDGACVDIASNPVHCGGCGINCGGALCSNGGCSGSCADGLTECGGTCVNTDNDPENCGGCVADGMGVACASPTDLCDGGGCTDQCSAGNTDCGGSCVDLQTDVTNCGLCGNLCANGTPCVDGSCSSAGCPTGQTDCNGTCVDTNSDPANCGECGTVCSGTESLCSLGGCVANCAIGLTECPANSGSCVDANSDPDHCGGCGIECAAGETCQDQSCIPVADCVAPYTDCDGSCVVTDSDTLNCGSCGVSCGDGSVCTVDQCAAGVCDNLSGALSCDDGNVCTDPDCDPTSGCVPPNSGTNIIARADLEAICQQTSGMDPTTECIWCDPFGEQCNSNLTGFGGLCLTSTGAIPASLPVGNSCAICDPTSTGSLCVADDASCGGQTCSVVFDATVGQAQCL